MRIRLIAMTCLTVATVCAAGCDGDDDMVADAGEGGDSAGRTTAGSGGTARGGVSGHAGSISETGGVSHGGSNPNAGGLGGDMLTNAGAGGDASSVAGEGSGGAAGAGGAEPAAEPANLTIDEAAKTLLATDRNVPTTLYFFGRDIPAGPTTSALSACTDTCIQEWPVFHQPAVVAGPGLKTSDFAELVRPDGKRQSTFRGWPLYSFAGDTSAGQRSGDGVDKLWHAVEQPFYSLVVMRGQAGGVDTGLYLADGAGRSIYRLLGDQAGTAGSNPVSTCTTNGCRKAWPVVAPMLVKRVSSIGGAFTAFIRPDSSEVQLAYGGAPIYNFAPDLVPGDLKGVGKPSWVLAAP